MKVVRTIRELHGAAPSGRAGLVPTMGAFHEGHLSLFRAARRECDVVVVSLFVNPAQFGTGDDLDRYPRDEARDVSLAEEAGVDVLFAPSPEEMYPEGFGTWIEVEEAGVEGAARPGHFRGVATVCLKLFNIAQPQVAYFGQKDAQQLAIIRRMVRDLDASVEIVGLPIVRDADGLALSSRNVYLTPEQREAALSLNRSLRVAESMFAAGERRSHTIRDAVTSMIGSEPLAQIDYVSVADGESLEELEAIDHCALVSVAARFGDTRLIDNTVLTP